MTVSPQLVPMAIALSVVVVARLVLMRRQQRQTISPSRRPRRGTTVFLFLPLVMISMAALSGAFSALNSALGIALAPITLGAGIVLGVLPTWQARRSQGGAGGTAPQTNLFWVFIGLVAVRMGVVALSSGDPSQSVLHIVSADLMLTSVGMALTRIALTVRNAQSRPGPK